MVLVLVFVVRVRVRRSWRLVVIEGLAEAC